ncbi:MAG: hypothetical protein K6G38_05340 [Gammaproteobacteria bacterium]|nr:hypothetical protein [Gammaproteobacteria bacterium]
MATKGFSNRYGNTRGGYGKNNPHGVNYEWAKDFNHNTLNDHYKKHKNEFNSKSKESYKQKAIKFANDVDKKNCKAYVDINGTTYKFNNKTKELVIVNKKGTIITYYKVNKGFEITVKKGVKKWIK